MMSTLTTPIQHHTGSSKKAIRQEKEKVMKIRKQ